MRVKEGRLEIWVRGPKIVGKYKTDCIQWDLNPRVRIQCNLSAPPQTARAWMLRLPLHDPCTQHDLHYAISSPKPSLTTTNIHPHSPNRQAAFSIEPSNTTPQLLANAAKDQYHNCIATHTNTHTLMLLLIQKQSHVCTNATDFLVTLLHIHSLRRLGLEEYHTRNCHCHCHCHYHCHCHHCHCHCHCHCHIPLPHTTATYHCHIPLPHTNKQRTSTSLGVTKLDCQKDTIIMISTSQHYNIGMR